MDNLSFHLNKYLIKIIDSYVITKDYLLKLEKDIYKKLDMDEQTVLLDRSSQFIAFFTSKKLAIEYMIRHYINSDDIDYTTKDEYESDDFSKDLRSAYEIFKCSPELDLTKTIYKDTGHFWSSNKYFSYEPHYCSSILEINPTLEYEC